MYWWNSRSIRPFSPLRSGLLLGKRAQRGNKTISAMNKYFVTVLYYIAEGQTNGHMEVEAPNETEAIKQVLDYMQKNMRLHPEYRLNMVQVSPR